MKVTLLLGTGHHSKSFFAMSFASVASGDFILNESSSSMDLRASTKGSHSLVPAMKEIETDFTTYHMQHE